MASHKAEYQQTKTEKAKLQGTYDQIKDENDKFEQENLLNLEDYDEVSALADDAALSKKLASKMQSASKQMSQHFDMDEMDYY